MSGVLLDTSVLVSHLRGRLDLLEHVRPDEPLFLSLTTLGELYKGAVKSTEPARNVARVEELLRHMALLHPDQATAKKYADIAAQLERQGTPIPQNDLWIAACALDYGLPIATHDAHFERVNGLDVRRW
jgi:tRNA(fMet)-specific endonuclease VapC